MGGTFDPVHIGHLLMAEFAYEDFCLDEIWFLPNGNPPHKQTEEMEHALMHRVEMIRRAIQDVPHFQLCLHEAKEKEHSYTYKTMRELKEKYPEHQFYFILGADSLFSIEQWKCFREIFPSCIILAAMRDDKDVEDMKRQIHYLEKEYGARIELLQAPLLEISSTALRKRAERGKSVRYMVPDAVADYIRAHELYRSSPDKSEALHSGKRRENE